MTEEKAIKILERTKRNCGLPEQGTTWKPNAETNALDMAIEALERKKDNRWIPCSERLPEESLNSVIGWDEYRKRCVFVQYVQGKFQNMGTDDSFNITAWQPLPEPHIKRRVKKVVEQEYKELTAAVKESDIALKLQKELQRLIDKEYVKNEKLHWN